MKTRGRRPDRPAHRRRPVCHLSLRDAERRASIARALRDEGWTVHQSPTGYQLIESIAGVILGDERPCLDLIVADAVSPGCSGISIAGGLRDLGWSIPIVLVGRSRLHLAAEDPECQLFTVDDPELALPTILGVARRCLSHLSHPSRRRSPGRLDASRSSSSFSRSSASRPLPARSDHRMR